MASLSFVFVLRGGSGDFNASFSLIDPQGGAVVKPAKLGVEKKGKKAHMMGIQIRGATFKSVGQYTVLLQLDQKRYEFPLKIGVRTRKEALAALT